MELTPSPTGPPDATHDPPTGVNCPHSHPRHPAIRQMFGPNHAVRHGGPHRNRGHLRRVKSAGSNLNQLFEKWFPWLAFGRNKVEEDGWMSSVNRARKVLLADRQVAGPWTACVQSSENTTNAER